MTGWALTVGYAALIGYGTGAITVLFIWQRTDPCAHTNPSTGRNTGRVGQDRPVEDYPYDQAAADGIARAEHYANTGGRR